MKQTFYIRRQLVINLRYCCSARTQNMPASRSLPAIDLYTIYINWTQKATAESMSVSLLEAAGSTVCFCRWFGAACILWIEPFTCTWSVFWCIWPRREWKSALKRPTIVLLEQPNWMYVTSEWQYNGNFQIPQFFHILNLSPSCSDRHLWSWILGNDRESDISNTRGRDGIYFAKSSWRGTSRQSA